MKYQVYNKETHSVEAEFFSRQEAEDVIEYDFSFETHTIIRVIPCRGCDSTDVDERYDYYGISTGYWCDDCYENNYPYKKERYATEEYDGYGERLND